MRKIFIVAVLCMASIPALADNWEYVGSSDNGSKNYIKNKSVKSGVVDFWLKDERPEIKECSPNNQALNRFFACEEKSKEFPIGSQVSHMIIDCKSNKLKMLANIVYGRKGEVIGATEETGKEKWTTIFPDTMGEMLHQNICK